MIEKSLADLCTVIEKGFGTDKYAKGNLGDIAYELREINGNLSWMRFYMFCGVICICLCLVIK